MEPREGLPEVRLVIDIQTEYCIAEPLRPMGGGDENARNAVEAHTLNKRTVTLGHRLWSGGC